MLCVALLFLWLPKLLAQNETVPSYRPLLGLKVVPLPVFDVVSSIQFGVEIATFKNQAFQLEYAFPVNFWNRNRSGEKISHLSGYKLKTEYRFYNKNAWLDGVFYGLQYMYKLTNVEDEIFLWLNNRSYQQLLPIRIRNTTHAGYILMGKVFPMFDKLFFEMATGVGLRRIEVEFEDVPPMSEPVEDFNQGFLANNQDEGISQTPAMFISFKFTWAFGVAKH